MNRSRLLFLVCSCLLVLPMLMALVLAADPTFGQSSDLHPRSAVSSRAAANALKTTHGLHEAGSVKEEDTFDTYLKYLKVFSEVLGLIRDTYVDEPNTEALMAGALEGVTDAMDPFSVYVPGPAVAGYVKALAAGKSLSGLALLKERGATLVMAVEKGSPADAAGLRVGDLVAKLDGTSTRTMPIWEMQEQLAGAPGTKITFELIRLGAPVQASFELKPFSPPAVALTQVTDPADPGAAAAMLRIPSFTADTAAQVRGALGPRGTVGDGKLLIDLRGVSSGEPEEAYEVARAFANGELGALMRRQQQVHDFESSDTPVWRGRLVLLVDRGTAGAAEVFAAVLHQRAGAELVGERTLGYAGHQATADLSAGSRLFFTDAFYTGPDRKPINESLKPDLLVSERNRAFEEKDVPMSDLILRRGVHHLLKEPAEAAKKAA